VKAAWRSFDAKAIAVALVVPLFIFRDSVFGGGVLFERDLHLLWHGQIEGFVRSVAAGSWPWWDPWIGFGQPLLANPNAQVYYPPTWLNLLMRPWTYYTAYAVAHLAWAGLGMFALARSLDVSPPGARVASIVWMASGPLLSLVSMWNHYAGAAWMPWVVAAAVRLADRPCARRAAVLGAAVAAQFLAGSPDMSAYTGLANAAVLLAAIGRKRGEPRQAARLAALAVLAATLAAALAAAQWMPTLEIVLRSARWGLTGEARTFWSVHPLGALELLLPDVWQTIPLSAAGKALLAESREPFLPSIYLGLPALGLVLAALAAPRPGWALMAGLGAVAVLIALGRHSPFYEAAGTVFPILRLSRFPVKALPLATMAWACLAGAGWDVWRQDDAHARRRMALVAGLLAATVACGLLTVRLLPWMVPSVIDSAAGHGFRGYFVAAVLAGGVAVLAGARALGARHATALATAAASIAAADLLAFHRDHNPAAPPALYLHRPQVVEALAGAGRVFPRGPEHTPWLPRERLGTLVRIPQGWTKFAAEAMAQQMSLEFLSHARWALPGSFSIDYMSLHPRHVLELAVLLASTEGTPGYERVLRLCGVTHVVTRAPGRLGTLAEVREIEGLLSVPVRILTVASPLPRLLVVGASRTAGNPAALLDPGFDPAREVLLADGPASSAAEAFRGAVEGAAERPDAITAEVLLSHPGFLVVLDTFDPGWRARVDGLPAVVLRANHAFRAVPVPAGRHRVELEYRPWSVQAGIAVSLVAVMAAAAYGWRASRGPQRA
jgi:membrane protein YfhO